MAPMIPIYRIKISLIKSKPIIWRRVLVKANMGMYDFHKVIQTSMGWTNSHLHQFESKDGKSYSKVYPSSQDDFDENGIIDYEGMQIGDFLKEPSDQILYEYDFGDSWNHDIMLEKVEMPVPYIRYPVCLEGKGNCPPEDIGGIYGFNNMLKILKNPSHPEFYDFISWLGGKYDPNALDLFKVNDLLARKDLGVKY
jgi:hypothetical protein